jgi:polyferredoxin
MTRCKKTCKILKEIRQQIAEKNDIEYITSECHFQGECQGTCPKCEAELKYLENELQKRRQLGKTAAVAGISLGIAGSFSACNTPQKQMDTAVAEQEIITDSVRLDTIPNNPKLKPYDLMVLGDIVSVDLFDTIDVIDTIVPIEEDIEVIEDDFPFIEFPVNDTLRYIPGGVRGSFYKKSDRKKIKTINEKKVVPLQN